MGKMRSRLKIKINLIEALTLLAMRVFDFSTAEKKKNQQQTIQRSNISKSSFANSKAKNITQNIQNIVYQQKVTAVLAQGQSIAIIIRREEKKYIPHSTDNVKTQNSKRIFQTFSPPSFMDTYTHSYSHHLTFPFRKTNNHEKNKKKVNKRMEKDCPK